MPRLLEMGTLIERSKRRADKENDDHISTAEWRALISEVWGADVFQVVADSGLRYFEYTATLTTTGAATVTEPVAIAKAIRLDYVDASGDLWPVQPIGIHDQVNASALTGTIAQYFALVDDLIFLYPTPASGQTYKLLYVPQATNLSSYATDDVIDVVSADGEACVIWGVAALAKVKASQDASLHLQKQTEHRQRLAAWAADRVIAYALARPAANEYGERFAYDEGDYR